MSIHASRIGSSHRALRICAAIALSFAATSVGAAALDALAQKDAVTGLRTALTQGASQAVARLGVPNGFLGNPEVKIPLPGKLQKAEKTLRMLGLGQQTDELVTAMNRAAEAAVPEAKVLLVDAVKQMSVTDAKTILTGGDDAATQYFRSKTSDRLTAKFLPIVRKSTEKVGLTARYNAVAGRLSALGVLDAKDANLESYVTNKTLDGLFLMMAKEEAAIRKNPLGQASSILQRVFGSIGH
jgi:hypothetical protein